MCKFYYLCHIPYSSIIMVVLHFINKAQLQEPSIEKEGKIRKDSLAEELLVAHTLMVGLEY